MENRNLAIYFFSGTHWDREWYQTFQGLRYRLVNAMNEIIDILEADPEFGVFHLDGQTIVVEDYLEIESSKKERLLKLLQSGKLKIGPWYVMPDEFLLSGESLIRNLMIGHKIAQECGTHAWKYGYICDIFGHIAQMPQIFNGFGIKYTMLGRGTNEHTIPAHFIWKAPDGSECITHKLVDKNGYGAFYAEVMNGQDISNESIQELNLKIREYVDYEIRRSDIPFVVVMDSLDHESIHVDTPKYIKRIRDLYPEAVVRHAGLDEMGSELEAYRQFMRVKTGELNETAKVKSNYIHLITHTLSSRYPIKKANDECQSLLEKWLEPLVAVAELRGFSIQKAYVDMAYKYLIQNHPHDSICGCSIDQVHKDMEYRFDQAKTISNTLIDEIFSFERKLHTINKDSQTEVLLVWNPLPFPRKEVVTVDIEFSKDYKNQYQEPFGYELKNSFKIYDHNGLEIPYGIVCIRKNYTIRKYHQYNDQGDLYTISLEVNVPAMGTAEYKIVPYENASRYLDVMTGDESEAENEFIRLKINENGTISIFDKASNKFYHKLLSYVDDGEIGDGWYHANPAEDRVVSSMGSNCMIERVENGPSRTVFRVTNIIKVPDSMEYYDNGIRRSQNDTVLKICSLVGLSKGAKFIDIKTIVNNTARDHRLRLKIPTGIKSTVYFANQAFTFVERKSGIKLETQDWKECDVLEKQMGGIVGRRNADGTGLAFISEYGLHECGVSDDDDGTIFVTLFRSFRKTIKTNGEEGGQILGDLHFSYRLVPMQPDTEYSDLTLLQDCLQTGFKSTTFRTSESYELSEPVSYFGIKGKGICMSIMKRPENAEKNSVVIRLYNMSDKESQGEIHSLMDIRSVKETNMNEEQIGVLHHDKNTVKTDIKAWGIKTLQLTF